MWHTPLGCFCRHAWFCSCIPPCWLGPVWQYGIQQGNTDTVPCRTYYSALYEKSHFGVRPSCQNDRVYTSIFQYFYRKNILLTYDLANDSHFEREMFKIRCCCLGLTEMIIHTISNLSHFFCRKPSPVVLIFNHNRRSQNLCLGILHKNQKFALKEWPLFGLSCSLRFPQGPTLHSLMSIFEQ